jgi:hypothetical protein
MVHQSFTLPQSEIISATNGCVVTSFCVSEGLVFFLNSNVDYACKNAILNGILNKFPYFVGHLSGKLSCHFASMVIWAFFEPKIV